MPGACRDGYSANPHRLDKALMKEFHFLMVRFFQVPHSLGLFYGFKLVPYLLPDDQDLFF